LAEEEDTNRADSNGNNGRREMGKGWERDGGREEAGPYKEADKSRDRLREMERFIANLKSSK